MTLTEYAALVVTKSRYPALRGMQVCLQLCLLMLVHRGGLMATKLGPVQVERGALWQLFDCRVIYVRLFAKAGKNPLLWLASVGVVLLSIVGHLVMILAVLGLAVLSPALAPVLWWGAKAALTRRASKAAKGVVA